MQFRTIHPFPARMASDLALDSLRLLPEGSMVLDPMVGSGTVLRHAVSLGHNAIGFDMDPLAVLISRVWTTPINDNDVLRELDTVILEARLVNLQVDRLPWLENRETRDFVGYWFDAKQRRDLKRISYVLSRRDLARLGTKRRNSVNVLKVALSRIIVTKEQVASLARDTSHSRPHKVSDSSNFDVFSGFERSTHQLVERLTSCEIPRSAEVRQGDVRELDLKSGSVDAVITSPPYLNAIDYLRGHRLSLVWLGYTVESLRAIRSDSIGAERKLDQMEPAAKKLAKLMYDGKDLPPRSLAMIGRYAADLIRMTSEVGRVLKARGQATFVVGNSCLRGAFIRNSDGVLEASIMAGLTPVSIKERELPTSSRYLPMPASGSLSKRMRTETILTLQK